MKEKIKKIIVDLENQQSKLFIKKGEHNNLPSWNREAYVILDAKISILYEILKED